MAWDTILFDLDGTLTDSGPGILNAVAYAVGKLGLPAHERDFYRRFIGPPLQVSFQTWCGLDEAGARRAVEVYREYYNDTGIWENAPYPGVPELLGELEAAGKVLMVASAKPEVMAVRVLEHFGLMEHLRYVAGASLNEARDQKSEAIRRCLERSAGRAFMVGDRLYDVRGAHENGIGAIGVLYGYGGRQELEEAGADALAEDVPALRQLLLTGTEINTKE